METLFLDYESCQYYKRNNMTFDYVECIDTYMESNMQNLRNQELLH